MGDKVKQVPAKVKETFAKMGKGTKALLAAVLVITIAAVAGIIIHRANRPYSVLFTGLTSEDMSTVLTYLDTNGVTDYKVRNNDTILVQEDQEASLKAKLLMEGYPTSGFGYSTYLENVNALSSESDRDRLFLFDLQDSLSAVVRCFDGVKDAHVYIAEGEDNRYILNDDAAVEASASVTVEMQGNQTLTSQQATAIRNLIGSAVKGLNFDNISIADTSGTTYASGDTESVASSDSSQLKLDLERKVDETVRNKILQVLTPFYGAENLSVGVNSTVDVSRSYTDTTTYELPAWAADGSTNGEGIIGSKVYDNSIVQGDNEGAGGIAGTATNADLNEYVESYTPNGNEEELHTSGETQYDNNQTQTQTETAAGVVTDLMVSVSINSSAVTVTNVNNLVTHVARAAGIDPAVQNQKISIMSVPFYEAPPELDQNGINTGGLQLPRWALFALIAGIALFLLLLLLILLISGRRKKKRRLLEEQEAAAQAEQLSQMIAAQQGGFAVEGVAGQQGADIMDIHTEKAMELRKAVRDFVESNPEIAAQLVRSWLKGGDENGTKK